VFKSVFFSVSKGVSYKVFYLQCLEINKYTFSPLSLLKIVVKHPTPNFLVSVSPNLGSILYLVITHLPSDHGTFKDCVSSVRVCVNMVCTVRHVSINASDTCFDKDHFS